MITVYVVVWQMGNSIRPSRLPNTCTPHPFFLQDDVLMASRGADNTLKLWDLRAFKRPLAVWDNLDTNYANTSCCFSPDDRLLLTGTCSCVWQRVAALPHLVAFCARDTAAMSCDLHQIWV